MSTATATRTWTYDRAQGVGLVTGGNGLQFPTDVAYDGAGRVYVLNRSASWAHPHPRVTVLSADLENRLAVLAPLPNEPDILQAPVALALDDAGQVYVTDNELNRVTIFGADGEMVGSIGEPGTGPGQFDQPAGIVVVDDDVWVVDQGNARIQRFTRAGAFVATFGSPGDGPGRFDNPWGVAAGPDETLWVSDWRNDRVQWLDPDGSHRATIGIGVLRRPAGLMVTNDGLVIVADWGNDVVRVFDGAALVATLEGAARTTSWQQQYLEAFSKNIRLRDAASGWLADIEPRLSRPSGVAISPTGDILIADTGRHRVQAYTAATEVARRSLL